MTLHKNKLFTAHDSSKVTRTNDIQENKKPNEKLITKTNCENQKRKS
jgi:hypothetical protein